MSATSRQSNMNISKIVLPHAFESFCSFYATECFLILKNTTSVERALVDCTTEMGTLITTCTILTGLTQNYVPIVPQDRSSRLCDLRSVVLGAARGTVKRLAARERESRNEVGCATTVDRSVTTRVCANRIKMKGGKIDDRYSCYFI